MNGKQAIGAALIGFGLLLLIAALTNRVGAVFAALAYGAGVLKPAASRGSGGGLSQGGGDGGGGSGRGAF